MSGETHIIVARKVFRIGVQTLVATREGWYVMIHNRTYQSSAPIPDDKVEAWKKALA